MASFISQSHKDALGAVFNDLHDTWKLPLKAFKEQKKVILSTNPSYNHIYGSPIGNQERTRVERTIEARIHYVSKDLDKKSIAISDQDAIRLAFAEHQVRIKVTIDDYEFLKTAERIQIDDNIYAISSAERPHGLFNKQFYTIYLKKQD